MRSCAITTRLRGDAFLRSSDAGTRTPSGQKENKTRKVTRTVSTPTRPETREKAGGLRGGDGAGESFQLCVPDAWGVESVRNTGY